MEEVLHKCNFFDQTTQLLWQPLDQCPMTAQTINLTGGISSGEHKLCNLQKNSTENHNSILLTIYIIYPWSMLQLCVLP